MQFEALDITTVNTDAPYRIFNTDKAFKFHAYSLTS